MPVVVIANPKGGVGKTTLATNLAGYFASQGHAVMLGDTDRQLVYDLLQMDSVIDMVIPRGGAGLHEFCRKNSRIPVITGGIPLTGWTVYSGSIYVTTAGSFVKDLFSNGVQMTVALSLVVVGLSWLNRLCDDFVLNLGFDTGCRSLQTGGDWLSRWQNGWLQRYLRLLGLAVVILVLMLVLGCRVL